MKSIWKSFLDKLAVNENRFEQGVIVVFHNLEGYDKMFVLQEIYRQHRPV